MLGISEQHGTFQYNSIETNNIFEASSSATTTHLAVCTVTNVREFMTAKVTAWKTTSMTRQSAETR